MSATTASERARDLIDTVDDRAYMVGADGSERAKAALADARAALLAYVARLEACVAAARAYASEQDMPTDVFGLSKTRDALDASLAALDRPEDGNEPRD